MKKLYFLITFIAICTYSNAQILIGSSNLNEARYMHDSELLNNGKVLAVGGDNGVWLSPESFSSCELYNPATNSWSFTGSMNQERHLLATAMLPSGNVLAIGGSNVDLDALSSCEIYDIATSTWSYTDSMLQERKFHDAIELSDGRILVVGGLPTTNTTEIYDPSTSTWSYTGDVNVRRDLGFSLVMLVDGRIMVSGGDDAQSKNSAEIYDPQAGTWQLIPNDLTESRKYHSSVLLDNGQVLIVGGSNYFPDKSELFDPVSNTFSASITMQEVRSGTPAIKLDNGNVLVYGFGDMFNFFDTKIIEVYNHTYQSWSSDPYSGGGVSGYTIHKLMDGNILTVAGNFSTGNGASSGCRLIGQDPNSNETAESSDEVVIYPNPSSDVLSVLVRNHTGTQKLNIFDVLGKVVLSKELTNKSSKVQVSHLQQGTYHFNIECDNRVYAKSSLIICR
jgi:hypothetical protein